VFASRAKALKLRYLVRLYAKKMVRQNFPGLRGEELLDRLIELYSAADSARDLRLSKRPTSIARRIRITRFCSSVSAAKLAAVSALTGISDRGVAFMRIDRIRTLETNLDRRGMPQRCLTLARRD
jgi:hypothetical protein